MPVSLMMSPDRKSGSSGEKVVEGFQALVASGRRGHITVSLWEPGDRSDPQVANCERVGYVTEGVIDVMMVGPNEEPIGRELSKGGFFRVPPFTVFWFRNRGRVLASLVQFIVPFCESGDLDAENPETGLLIEPWEHAAPAAMPVMFKADAERYPIIETEKSVVTGDSAESSWVLREEEVESFSVVHNLRVGLTTKVVYGETGSIMVARRPNGYHSTPHFHACEQINFVSEGEIWGYVADLKGNAGTYHLKQGDLWRVPDMAVHWTWNQSGAPCELVEFHSPGMHADPDLGHGAVGLFGETEARRMSGEARNVFIDPLQVPVELIEGQVPSGIR